MSTSQRFQLPRLMSPQLQHLDTRIPVKRMAVLRKLAASADRLRRNTRLHFQVVKEAFTSQKCQPPRFILFVFILE